MAPIEQSENLGRCVAVGMSGGVDSAVTALLLKRQGFDVFGLFMKNWEEITPSGRCHAEKDWQDVIQICELIDIPCYSVNFVEEYRQNVFAEFLSALQKGLTPNPDVLCNREIKFKVLLDKAFSLGAHSLATGHYCRKKEEEDGKWSLLKGSDPDKDQSYFLCALNQKALAHALFPLGELVKKQVREMALKAAIPVAEKKDSTGICFIGKRDFKGFVSQYLPYSPGNIETAEGKIVGRHDGVAYYTIGQRQGLKIGGAGDAWFVADKDIANNVLKVVQGTDHPALFRQELIAAELSWIADEPPKAPFTCSAKVRYRQRDQRCLVTLLPDNSASVCFEEPQRAVTAGQYIAFYSEDTCLGGGVIHSL